MRIVHAFFSDLVHHIKIYFFLGKQCGEKATAYKRNNCPSHVCDFWLKVSVLVLHVEGCMTIFDNTKLRVSVIFYFPIAVDNGPLPHAASLRRCERKIALSQCEL